MTKKIRENNNSSIKKESRVQQAVIEQTSKEIYENITQCLCLVRLQLGNIDLNNKEKTLTIIGEANLLIGKAVRDLRNLAKNLSSFCAETKINY